MPSARHHDMTCCAAFAIMHIFQSNYSYFKLRYM
jgi:hypothetical protein